MPFVRRSRLTAEERTQVERALVKGDVYFHPLRSRFEHNHRPLKGITETLRVMYWPHYRMPAYSDSGVLNRRGNRGNKGWSRGSRVGREIAKWGNTGKLPRNAHSFTRRFVNHMITNGAQPAAGEYPIGDVTDTMLGTGVDLITQCFIDEKQEQEGGVTTIQRVRAARLIEIKTGSANCWTDAQGHMLGILQQFPCSPANMAMVQLALTCAIFKRYRPRVKTGPCSVIHITADSIDERMFSWSSLLRLGNMIIQDIKRQWNEVH